MRSSKAQIGSLSQMHDKLRQEKKASASTRAKAPLARAREQKKTFKSAETVHDTSSDSESTSDSGSTSGSDGDGDLDAARAKFLAKKAAKQKKDEAKVNGTKLTTTATATATPAKPPPSQSTPTSAQKPTDASGSESESETSDTDRSTPSNKPTSRLIASQNKPGVNKVKRGSSSESTSSSGSSSESEEAPSTGAEVNSQAFAKRTTINDQESSSEESDSGSESDDEGDGGKMDITRTNGENASTSSLSRPPWLNNSDFMLRKVSSSNPGKEVADFFSNVNLEGKQVWYFTAPASLPITVLKDMEIDLAKATKGGPLLTHKGDDYGLDLESYATNTQIQLLIPSRGGDKYTALNHGIDSTVHLRRMAKFGPGGEVHATATKDYIPVPRPIREQPEGLRVRYTPIGVPTPAVSNVTATKTINSTPPNTSNSQAKIKGHTESSSSSESESESGSDVEMTTPPPRVAPASQTKSSKSGTVNGHRKRKHSGDGNLTTPAVTKSSTPAEKPAKRLRAGQSSEEASAKKQTPVQPPNPAATSTATPSKRTSSKAKENKEKVKKDKTPKAPTTPASTARQTPIPLPTIPGMKR